MKKLISLILAFALIFTSGSGYIDAQTSPHSQPSIGGLTSDRRVSDFMAGAIAEGTDSITDDEIVASDSAWLTADVVLNVNNYSSWKDDVSGDTYYYNITNNLNLPSAGEKGSTISWVSTDQTIIETNGTVHRPSYADGNKSVVITANITKGYSSLLKSFNIEVSSLDATQDESIVEADYNWLVGENVIYPGRYSDDISSNVNLPTTGENGSTISWTSSNESIILSAVAGGSPSGTVNRPSFSYAMGKVPVTLTATITSGIVSKQKSFDLKVVPEPPQDADKVALDKIWLTYDIVLNENSDINNIKSKLNLPVLTQQRYQEGIWSVGNCDISWASSDSSVIAEDGSVTRPAKGSGNKAVRLTATISLDEAVDTKIFDFVVIEVEEFPLAINYNNFSDTTRLHFNGVAGTVNTTDMAGNEITALQLDNNRETVTTTGGSIFVDNKIRLGDNLSFSTGFSYRNPHPSFTTGTGGFVFTLQSAGNTVYAQNLRDESIRPSVSIAFVTDYNTSQGSGQATNYFYTETAAVYFNGDYNNRITQMLTSGLTNDPVGFNYVWIEYNGTAKTLELRFSTTDQRPANSNLKIENLDLGQMLTGAAAGLNMEDVRDVYAGFMGSMGDAKDKSEIGSWFFKNDSVPIDFTSYIYKDLSKVIISADPAAGASISTITALIEGTGGPVTGIPVEFSTTVGTFDAASAITDGTGKASAVLSTTVPGIAKVTAAVPGGATANAEVLLAVGDGDSVGFDAAWLTEARILGDNTTASAITVNMNLPVAGLSGSNINWSSSQPDVISTNGEVTRPDISAGPVAVTLTAAISKGDTQETKVFNVIVKVRDSDLAAADKDWLTTDKILNGNSDVNNVTGDLVLPVVGEKGSSISWSSDRPEVVGTDGTVHRPLHTLGDQTVILTATVTSGTVSLSKSFTVIAKAADATDLEAVEADYSWLNEADTLTLILNGNEQVYNIISDLYLPASGLLGTPIQWTSSDEKWVALSGKVTRPSYGEGSQNIKLTATVSKGIYTYTKEFYFGIVKLATDEEAVQLDSDWLTRSLIMGSNTDVYTITDNMNLPVLGGEGSTIVWTSSNETVITTGGTVIRPTYTQGSKAVKLNAVISRGEKSNTKSFSFVVYRLEPSDEEALQSDMNRLTAYYTLGGNPSPYSVTQDLSLPALLPMGSSVTWESDFPGTISGSGEVNRPEYNQPHKTVTLTAELSRGGKTDSKTLKYTVLAKPDIYMPKVTESSPSQGSFGVLWDTQQIIITFDENIKAATSIADGGSSTLGIELQNSPDTQFTVTFDNNKLLITPYSYFPSGTNKLIIPNGAISDLAGNIMDSYELNFTVEEKLKRNVELLSSTPLDKEKSVSVSPIISLQFNISGLEEGSAFTDKWLCTADGLTVPVTPTMKDSTVTLIPGYPLKAGTVYEITVPAGAVRDRFMNENSDSMLRFKTISDGTAAVVKDIYPYNGQKNINIHQHIEVNFSKAVKPSQCNLVLKDSLGNIVGTIKEQSVSSENTVIITPCLKLIPNMEYTLSGAYDSDLDPSGLEFSSKFTTGGNGVELAKISPESLNAPINKAVEIQYSSTISKGPGYSNIKLMDSEGKPVAFRKEESSSKALLIPSAALKSSGIYTVEIPAGAYINGDMECDSYRFSFATADKLSTDSLNNTFQALGLESKEICFNTDSIDNRFASEKHAVISYEWNFGDNTVGTGKNPIHIYNDTGEYTVELTIADDKGFTYKMEHAVTILSPDKLNMTVIPSQDSTVYIDSRNHKKLTYKILLEYNGIFVSGEKIKPNLSKNGIVQRTYPEITAGVNDKEYTFNVELDNALDGEYDMVFTRYDGQAKKEEVRSPLIINGHPAYVNPVFSLYNTESHSFFEGAYLNVELNGVKTEALRQFDSSSGKYYYVIKSDVIQYERYPIKISGWELKGSYILADDYRNIRQLTGKPANFGITWMTNDLSESERLDVISGSEMGYVSFFMGGEWNGLDKGYYEMKTDTGSYYKTSYTGRFTMYPSRELKPGDHLMARMVSGENVTSSWKYLDVYVFEKPDFLGLGVDIKYVNGEYKLTAPTGLSNILGGSIGILDDIPLLDGGNFGLGSSTPSFSGYIDKSGGDAVLNFRGGVSYNRKNKTTSDTKVKKVKKIVSSGYEVEAELDGELCLYYDYSAKKWKMGCAIISMEGYGGYKWTRGYKIPVIDVGIDATLRMGSSVCGVLKIDNSGNGTKYSGVIGIKPLVAADIMFGADWVNVTGYLEGIIPAEVHYPTGYVGADVSVTAKITGTFLTYTKTLYKKELVSEHWDNGKTKVMLKMAAMAPEGDVTEKDTELEMMSRDYLGRESRWLAGDSAPKAGLFTLNSSAGGESGNKTQDLLENIYPNAEVKILPNGDKLWMVWIDDNPERNAANRTQLRYSIWENGSWSEPKWMADDTTADFTPVLTATEDGVLMAWLNMKKEATEEGGFGELLENSEVAMTDGACSYESDEPSIIMASDDGMFDHSPIMVSDSGKALLVWTKSEGLGFSFGSDMDAYKAPANSDSLYYSSWNGSTWSSAEKIQGSLPTVVDSSLAMHGGQGLLLYTLDMDSNLSTSEDREVFSRIYDGSEWAAAIRLTDNKISDSNPEAVFVNGNWLITWYQDGTMMYKLGLSGKAETNESLKNISGDFKLVTGQSEVKQTAIVYKRNGEKGEGSMRVSASFYDADRGIWSGEIPLTGYEGYIASFSPAITQDGKLHVAYTNADIVTEVIDGKEQKNISDKVNLKYLTYSPVHDLSLSEKNGLQLSSEFPLPGTVTTVYATVVNEGDFPENAVVDLYDGDPSAGGVKIAETAMEQPLPARSSAELEIQWLVGDSVKEKYNLYAVVRSDNNNDVVMANNMLNMEVLSADAAITDYKCENISGNDYLVTAAVSNIGSKTLDGIALRLEQTGGGIVKSVNIGSMKPGGKQSVDFLFSSTDLEPDTEGRYNMVLRIIVPDSVKESTTENNIKEFTLEASNIVVEAINPAQGENLVELKTLLTISFDRMVEEGSAYGQILLEDEELNEVNINTALDGDTLTVTPQAGLQYDTRYTLTIPGEAVGDTNGRTLSQPYILSFTTVTSNPVIILSYPGKGMEDTERKSTIKLKYGCNILKGLEFSDISLMEPNSKAVASTVSISGEWLLIQPKALLAASTDYILTVPRNAVVNEYAEGMVEDYILEFTTAASTNDGGSGGNSGSPANTAEDKTIEQQGFTITEGTSENGLPMAIVSLNEQAVQDDGKNENTDIDLSKELKNYENVSVLITNEVIERLTKLGKGLNILTGSRQIYLPVRLIQALHNEGKINVTVDMKMSNNSRPGVRVAAEMDGKPFQWNYSGAPYIISLAYRPTENELLNSGSLIIRYADGNGKETVVVNGCYDKSLGAMTFSTCNFGNFTVDFNQVDFRDVQKKAWYASAVSYIAAREITSGTGNGNFSPNEDLSRGDFLVLLMKAYGMQPDTSSTDNFDDAGGTYYTGYLAAAKRLGISTGVGNNRFNPKQDISRQEMFTMLYNILKTMGELPKERSKKTLSDFSDNGQVASWAMEAIQSLIEAGVIAGISGNIGPENTATRAEFVQTIYNILSR